MATYTELNELRSDSTLRNRIITACAIKAAALIDLASPTTAQIAWAKLVLANPYAVANDIMIYVLAKNAAFTVAQIQGATDAAIQTNVGAAADKLLVGGV